MPKYEVLAIQVIYFKAIEDAVKAVKNFRLLNHGNFANNGN